MKPPKVTRELAQDAHDDGSTRRRCAGPLRIQNRFVIVACHHPWIRAIADPLAVGCTVVSEPEAYSESPNVERNVFQSSKLYRFVSSITATVCPAPVMPWANKGFKS